MTREDWELLERTAQKRDDVVREGPSGIDYDNAIQWFERTIIYYAKDLLKIARERFEVENQSLVALAANAAEYNTMVAALRQIAILDADFGKLLNPHEAVKLAKGLARDALPERLR